jgi:hypothetical protein
LDASLVTREQSIVSAVKVARFFSAAVAFLAIPALTLAACGDHDNAVIGSDASVDHVPRLDGTVELDASCPVFVASPDLMPTAKHVDELTQVTWSTNPPSSGDHFAVWANFKEFSSVVPLGYLVHSMEHGAVLLLYKCDAPPCTAVVEQLRKVRDAVPTEPICDPSIRVRVIIAQDPLLDVPVAAAAWGWTYKAQCVDVPTLTQFAKDHVGQGTENICSPGRDFD